MGKRLIADYFYRRLFQSHSTPEEVTVNWKWLE
jgi:hypothetical protein